VECRNKCDTSNNRGNWNLTKSLRKYLSNTLGKHEIKEIQKTATLGMAPILWVVKRTKLTPWSRVLPEKLKRHKILKKFPVFYGTQRFITVFTRACHLSLS
jgi:hypothetical protein